MFYAGQRGLVNVLKEIERLYEDTGEPYWAPATLLKKLVAEDLTLNDWIGVNG